MISAFLSVERIEGSRERRHNGVPIIQFSLSKMFLNLLFLTPKGHHSIILIKNLSIILLMDPQTALLVLTRKFSLFFCHYLYLRDFEL